MNTDKIHNNQFYNMHLYHDKKCKQISLRKNWKTTSGNVHLKIALNKVRYLHKMYI